MSVRNSLLALLGTGSAYGSQLRTRFEIATGGAWPLNIGQVYQTLDRLVRDGLVIGDNRASGAGPAQAGTRYRLTESGRLAATAWFAEAVAPAGPPRDELAIKVALACSIPGVDVLSVLDGERRAAMVRLQELTALRRNQVNSQQPWLLILDRMIFDAESTLRWLDHCQVVVGRATPDRTEQERGRGDG